LHLLRTVQRLNLYSELFKAADISLGKEPSMKRGTAKVSRVLLSSMVLAFSLSSLASAQAPPPTPNSVQTRMKLQDFVAGPDGDARICPQEFDNTQRVVARFSGDFLLPLSQ
jgi:hypothetical protein